MLCLRPISCRDLPTKTDENYVVVDGSGKGNVPIDYFSGVHRADSHFDRNLDIPLPPSEIDDLQATEDVFLQEGL